MSEMSDQPRAVLQAVAEDAYQLGEAQAEIARHHTDFERVRSLVDEWGVCQITYRSNPEKLAEAAGNLFYEIRKVVG